MPSATGTADDADPQALPRSRRCVQDRPRTGRSHRGQRARRPDPRRRRRRPAGPQPRTPGRRPDPSARSADKVVLVTGAAGSIGSELCRQIARFHPAGIVGFEIAESPLFEIDREMRQAFPRCPLLSRRSEAFRIALAWTRSCGQYRPSVVYHAAAYKHVPLMEAHVFEAIENNVFGTYNVAMAAAEARSRGLRHDLLRQGRAAHQRHGRHQARRRTAAPGPAKRAAPSTSPCASATCSARTAA